MTEADPEQPQAELNEYGVQVYATELGWEVRILDHSGAVVWARSCEAEEEAGTLASTVKQHAFWLSPAKFREYYRLVEAG